MKKWSPVPRENQGKTRREVAFHGLYSFVKGLLWLGLLYSASQWFIVHSPTLELGPQSALSALVLPCLTIAGAASVLVILLTAIAKGEGWPKKTDEQRSTFLWSILTISSVLSLVLLTFAGTVWVLLTTKQSGIAKIAKDAAIAALSNASTFALFVVTSLISIMALFGWQNLSSHIDSRVEKIAEDTKEELIGRFFAMTGHTMGELNLTKDFEAKDQDRMKTAVGFCQSGYEKLKDRKPGARLMALNNLTYYQALLKDPSNAPRLLAHSKELLEIGHEYRVPRLLLTYCRVVACYATNNDERYSAKALLASLLGDASLEPQERKEALHCQSLFSDPNLPYRATMTN